MGLTLHHLSGHSSVDQLLASAWSITDLAGEAKLRKLPIWKGRWVLLFFHILVIVFKGFERREQKGFEAKKKQARARMPVARWTQCWDLDQSACQRLMRLMHWKRNGTCTGWWNVRLLHPSYEGFIFWLRLNQELTYKLVIKPMCLMSLPVLWLMRQKWQFAEGTATMGVAQSKSLGASRSCFDYTLNRKSKFGATANYFKVRLVLFVRLVLTEVWMYLMPFLWFTSSRKIESPTEYEHPLIPDGETALGCGSKSDRNRPVVWPRKYPIDRCKCFTFTSKGQLGQLVLKNR